MLRETRKNLFGQVWSLQGTSTDPRLGSGTNSGVTNIFNNKMPNRLLSRVMFVKFGLVRLSKVISGYVYNAVIVAISKCFQVT